MKAWLSQNGVTFLERNVDEDLDAYHALLALGARSVPLTLVGDVAIAGYQPDRLAEALARKSAP